MTIEKRIRSVDLNGPVNTDWRAALHHKLSSVDSDAAYLKNLISQDFTLPLDPNSSKALNQLRSQIFEADPTRSYIILSPLGPFGIDAFLTKTSPLKVAHVSGRTADVVADPTIQLAAELYRQRAKGNNRELALGTSHRCVRLQRYKDPTFTTAFEMFATIDGANSQGKFYEEVKIAQLIGFYSGFFKNIISGPQIRISLGNIKIAERLVPNADGLTTEEREEKLQGNLPEEFNQEVSLAALYNNEKVDYLTGQLPIVNEIRSMKRVFEMLPLELQSLTYFSLNRILGLGHYNGPVFMLHVNDITLVDGGSVDWVAQLTANNKERAVVSGFGIELLSKLISS